MHVQITFDANDPGALADFWAEALDYVKQPPPDGFESWEAWATSMGIPEANWNDAAALVDPNGNGPRVFIQRVPEGKTAKNRMHLDLSPSGGKRLPANEGRALIDSTVAELVAIGATVVGPVEERGDYWVVLQDPEGNEFCVH